MRSLGLWIAAVTTASWSALALAIPAPAAAIEPVAEFGFNPGELDLFVHVPETVAAGAPLVVALHGCTQQASDFDDEPGLVELAETVPFVLVLPQQREANNAERCFNWFQREDNQREQGESVSIRNMVDFALTEFGADPDRVYALGLSAGGSMTAVLLANYPERFAGGAVIAGTPFACNRPAGLSAIWWWALDTFVGEAAAASFSCGVLTNGPTDRTAEDWGDAVREAAVETPEDWPIISLWQGDADDVVDPANQVELVEQWTNVQGIDAVADTSETVGRATRELYTNAAGMALVETWLLSDFPHALPIAPEAAPEPCGTNAPFIEDSDLCAVRRIATFWGLLP